ncbi:MAG TPA: 30S ribosomal protein S18 [Acidimicrobiia bacterium]|nr:30S ribosomal protein S18 [Acidimicrobiia bacterium]
MSPRRKNAPKKKRRQPEKPPRRGARRKTCMFCDGEATIDYKDVATLRRFMSDRAKIRSSRVTGTCGQHQRQVANAIKNARELALLPYLGK